MVKGKADVPQPRALTTAMHEWRVHFLINAGQNFDLLAFIANMSQETYEICRKMLFRGDLCHNIW